VQIQSKQEPISHEQAAGLSTSTPNKSTGPTALQNLSKILNSTFRVTEINILWALGM